MVKQRIKGLTGCLTFGILLITALHALSGWIITHTNGFLRKLPSHRIVGAGFIQLPNKYYYFAGTGDSTVYIGNWAKRGKLLYYTLPFKDSTVVQVKGFDTVKFSKGAYVRAEGNGLYLFDGNKPVMVSGNAQTGILLRRFPAPHFTTAAPISQASSALRVVIGDKNALAKLSGGKLSKPLLLDKQGEGIFSTDGMLIKVPGQPRLFYVYYYRNKFLCLDTNMHVLYTGKTIDTVAHAHIKVGTLHEGHELTLASPPAFVNLHCAANGKYLFIQSALKADNETDAGMKEVAPVDVYLIDNGRYLFTIYIANFRNKRVRDFVVCGHTLAALFDNYLYHYDLKF